MRGPQRVVVTGMSVRCAIGDGLEAFSNAASAGVNGIGRISRFDTSELPVQLAAECPVFDFEPWLSPEDIRRYDPMANLASIYVAKALADADIDPSPDVPKDIGVTVGASTGGWQRIDEGFHRFVRRGWRALHPFTIPRTMPNIVCGLASVRHNLRGGQANVSAACATGAVAIGSAFRRIRLGEEQMVVAGSVDALSTLSHFGAWCQLRVMSENTDPNWACMPFDAERRGMVLGEGVAFMVLESLEHARERGARIHAELVGYGETSDAAHMTVPHVEGQVAAMRKALACADMAPGDVDCINAHGTGTSANDSCEARAIREVFGDASPPVTSTKSMTGHCVCAAASVEAVATILSLRRQEIFPTINHRTPDAECPLDVVAGKMRPAALSTAMSNAFAFGGCNAVLIFSSESWRQT